MTVREEFAKAAMQGYAGSAVLYDVKVLEKVVAESGRGGMTVPQVVAMLAVQQADALIAELARQ